MKPEVRERIRAEMLPLVEAWRTGGESVGCLRTATGFRCRNLITGRGKGCRRARARVGRRPPLRGSRSCRRRRSLASSKSSWPVAIAWWCARTPTSRSCGRCYRRSVRSADDFAGGPDLSGHGRDRPAALDRWLGGVGARALHTGSALGAFVFVSESPRRSAEDSRVGSIGLLGALQAAGARDVCVAVGDGHGPRGNAERRSAAPVGRHGSGAHPPAPVV